LEPKDHPCRPFRVPTRREGLRVLVVDDSDELRQVVVAAIVSTGHQVVGEAADGLSAIAAALELDPDLVVMDWQMPRMDGLSATAAIRDRRPAIAIIGHSITTDADVACAFLRAGACAFVSKGDTAGLLAELRRSNGRSRGSADDDTPRRA
jgi:CheY-like chemotaxis protein